MREKRKEIKEKKRKIIGTSAKIAILSRHFVLPTTVMLRPHDEKLTDNNDATGPSCATDYRHVGTTACGFCSYTLNKNQHCHFGTDCGSHTLSKAAAPVLTTVITTF